MSVMVRLLLFALMSPKGTPAVPPCVRARGQEKRRGDRAAEGRTAISPRGSRGLFLTQQKRPRMASRRIPKGTQGQKERPAGCHFAAQSASAGGNGGFSFKARIWLRKARLCRPRKCR